MAVRMTALRWTPPAVGALWAALSTLSWVQGIIPGHVALWDAAALVPLAIALRWCRIGLCLALVHALLGAFAMDPTGLGLSSYITATTLAWGAASGRGRLAAFCTPPLITLVALTSYRRVGADAGLTGPLVAGIVIYAVAWLIAFGIRSFARAEAARVEARHRAHQLSAAADLHDFVSQELSSIAMAADARTTAPTAADFDLLVERVRRANGSLRDTTAVLRGLSTPTPRLEETPAVLKRACREVASQGGTVHVEPGAVEALTALPAEVNAVAGRIVAEALHNAVKHGDLALPCVVSAERTDTRLDLIVSNHIAPGPRTTITGAGLFHIGVQAESLGGYASSEAVGDRWVCLASLALHREGSTQ